MLDAIHKAIQKAKAHAATPPTPPTPPPAQPLEVAIQQAIDQREPTPKPKPKPTPKATSLLTEQIGDGDANCLEHAATQARPDQDNLVFVDDRRGAAEGNRNGAGHVLIEDQESGRVWDPNDGTAPTDPQNWTYESSNAWLEASDDYEEVARVDAAAVQDVLAADPADREAIIEASDNPDLQRIADHAFADTGSDNPFDIHLSSVCPLRQPEIEEYLGGPWDFGAEDVTTLLDGSSPLGELTDEEVTTTLDYAVNSWRGAENYDAVQAVARWASENPDDGAMIAEDFARRSLLMQELTIEEPNASIIYGMSSTLATASVTAAGTPEGRRALIDDLGEESGLLFFGLASELPAHLSYFGGAHGWPPTEGARADAMSQLLDAAALGDPTIGSETLVATAMASLTEEDVDQTESEFSQARPLARTFSLALTKHLYPNDPQAQHHAHNALYPALSSDAGSRLVFGEDVPVAARVENLNLIRANPQWGADLDYRDVEMAHAQGSADAYLQLRGDTPQSLAGTDLENTLGMAFGFDVQQEATTEANQSAMAEGRFNAFAGEPADEIIAPVADQIRNVGGESPDVTVLPLRYHDDDGNAVTMPLFRVQDEQTGEDRFVDNIGRRYDSFDDWAHNNELPPGRVIYPPSGHLTEASNGEVRLEERATPNTVDSFGEHVGQFLDTAALVGGTIAGVAMIVGSGGTAAPVVLGAALTWQGYRIGSELEDRRAHGQSLNPLTDADARRLWLEGGAIALTAVTLGSSSVARLGTTPNAFARTTARFAGLSASAVDGVAAANIGYELLDNWDELDGGQQTQMLLSLGFWSASSAATRRMPHVVPTREDALQLRDASHYDRFIDDSRLDVSEISRLTPAQLREVFPEGGAYPKTLEWFGDVPGFAEFARLNPGGARAVIDALPLDPTLPNQLRTGRFADVLSYVDDISPISTIHPLDDRFVVRTRQDQTPSHRPEFEVIVMPELDHNGAFQMAGPRGRRRRNRTLIPASSSIPPGRIIVDGQPLTSLDGVAIFGAHGGNTRFGGISTADAAELMAERIAVSHANGRPIEHVLLDSCNQRNCGIDFQSNGERFQQHLDAALGRRGITSDVDVLVARDPGVTYGGGYQSTWLRRQRYETTYTPASDGARPYLSREAVLLGLLGTAAAGEGYYIYTELND